MSRRTIPPFRADHVGSLLRPEALVREVRRYRSGEIGQWDLEAAQDGAIRNAVSMQEAMGLRSATDGEFRRRGWSAGFIDAVEGFGLRRGTGRFRRDGSFEDAALSPYAQKRLRRSRAIAEDEFRFVKDCVSVAMPKITIPSPPVMHYFLGPRAVDRDVYPDIEDYFADLISIYREEISALGAAGCRYLQLDDTALPCNCDEGFRDVVRDRGEDPDRLTARYVRLISDAVADRPAGMSVVMHLCRGNMKGAWMAAGGYEAIAEILFAETPVDAWFMEYDTERAGSFAPLRFMPQDKAVVLGLVSTKTPALESKDELKRRIDEASRYVPIERLCLSPQCGFSSAPGGGQALTEDDQRRKLELVVETAGEVWDEV